MAKVKPSSRPSWSQWFKEESKHGAADLLLSLLVVCVVVAFSFGEFFMSIYSVIQNYDKALPWVVLCNDSTGLCLHAGSIFLWFAVCFGAKHKSEADFVKKRTTTITHRVLRTKIIGTNDFLPGGFAPRMFACTMGLVLFVTGNLMTNMVIKGAKMLKPKFQGGMSWPVGFGCRATSKNLKVAGKVWLSRFKRHDATGCYNVDDYGVSDFFWTKPDKKTPNLKFPYITQYKSVNGTEIPYQVVDKAGKTEGYLCMYQCAKWKPIAFQVLLKNSGVIVAGATFIERLINQITSRYGYKFVYSNSSPEELVHSVELTLTKKNPFVQALHLTKFTALMLILSMEFGIMHLTPRLDKDGYYTIDYYVTMVFLFALVFAWFLRNFHPTQLVPIVHTNNLWSHGKDAFVGNNNGEPFAIDLYEWYHLGQHQRARYLVNYARRVDLKDVPFWEPNVTEKTSAERDEEEEDLTMTQPIDALKEKLLNVEERIHDLETAGHRKKKDTGGRGAKNFLDHLTDYMFPPIIKDKSPIKVTCIKSVEGFTDVFIPDTKQYERCRVTVLKGAQGEIVGKTHDEMLRVKWDNFGEHDDYVRLSAVSAHLPLGSPLDVELQKWKTQKDKEGSKELQEDDDDTFNSVIDIPLPVSPMVVLEAGKKWENLLRMIDEDEDEEKRESRQKKMPEPKTS